MKKNKKFKIILLLIGILACENINAKNPDSLFIYKGHVISQLNKTPVAMAHVINIQRQRGIVADTSGYFEVWVRMGDTLNISAIGFEYYEHAVQTSKDTIIEVYLKSRTYDIPEVAISYLGTYQEFKQKVLTLELPEIKYNEQLDKLFKHVDRAPLVVAPEITSPASLIYVLFSKDAKEIKRYLELEKEGKVKEKVYERYNEYIIRNITGLDLLEARKFMEFCNFQDKYILSINDYNLYSEIMLRFKAYQKSMQDSLIIE